MKQQSAGRYFALLRDITLNVIQRSFALTPWYCVLIPLRVTYFSWRVPSDFWRNVYIDRSVTPRIETIVWRYNAAICVGVQYGYTKGFNWMRYCVKININRSFIGRISRNLKILRFQNSYFNFFLRLEFIVHLKETLSWLCVSGMWSSKGKTTLAQLKTKV